MAAIEIIRPLAGGRLPGGRLSRFFNSFSNWNKARVTRRALGKLTDRELDDIGLSRNEIENLFG
ncbi:MAG: DUF1127 domain-containing protein [Paracoccaceae bacterium]